MNGDLDLDEIQCLVNNNMVNFSVNVMKIYELCLNVGLVTCSERELIKKKNSEFEMLSSKLKAFPLSKMYPIFDSIGKKLPIVLTIMIIFDMLFFLLLLKNHFIFPWGFIVSDLRSILYFIFLSSVSGFIHEMAHSILAYRYGVMPKTLNISIYAYISTMFYVELPGIYLLPESKRFKVWSAGIITNLFLASIFYTIYVFAKGQISLIAGIGAVCNLTSIIFNVLPFYHSDGYFLLSTILKIPNLRKESFSKTKQLFKGDFNKDTVVYFTYLIATAIFITVLAITQITFLIDSIYFQIYNDVSALDIIKRYINIIFLFFIGVVGRILKICRKKDTLKS